MATSYLSQKYEPSAVSSNINLPLTLKVLEMKQGKYDTAKAQINQTLDQFGGLKVLRDVDNKYIAAKLTDVRNNIETMGDVDLSRSGVADSIMGNIKQVAQDPFILNALEQTYKKKAYDTEAEKYKKDGKYSDINYQDGLEQGDYVNYMSGKTEKLGNLRYQEYVDVSSKLSKKAQEYVKLMGKKQLLQTTSDAFSTTDTFGEVVTMQDIYKTLESELDEKDLAQLKINARQSIGKLSKDDLAKTFEPTVKKEIEELKTNKASIQAKIKSAKGDEKLQLEQSLLEYDERIKSKTEQVDNKNYDIYGVYKDNFIKDIASDYDYQIVTDINRDYGRLQIEKFKFDIEKDKRDYALKEREVLAKEKEVKLTEQLTLPTITQKPKDSEVEADPIKDVQRNLVDTDKELDNYLKTSNESGYNTMTPQEQWAYKLSVKADDPTVKGNNLDRQNAIRGFQTAQKTYSQLGQSGEEQLKATTNKAFDAITGANLNNLATTMPYTVAAKRQGKPFNELDANVQKGIMLEMGANYLEFGGIDDDSRDRKVIDITLNKLNAQLKNHPSKAVQNIYNQVEPAYKNRNEEVGYVSGALDYVGNKIAQGISAITPSFAGFSPVYGMQAEQARQRYKRDTGLGEDTDITELEKGTDAKESVLGIFNNYKNAVVANTNNIAKSKEETLRNNKVFSYSTENKYQEPIALLLSQAILASDGNNAIPTANNNFTIEKNGELYKINYLTGSGAKQVQTSAYLTELPQAVQAQYGQALQKWDTSLYNSNLVLPTYTFKTPSQLDGMNSFQNIYENRPDIISNETFQGIVNRGTLKGTALQSKEDYLSLVKGQPVEVLNKANEIIDANFKVDTQVKNGQIMGEILITYPKTNVQEKSIFFSQYKELDEGRLYMEAAEKVKEIKENKIKSLID